jgi:SAM-dependent methyltransferase
VIDSADSSPVAGEGPMMTTAQTSDQILPAAGPSQGEADWATGPLDGDLDRRKRDIVDRQVEAFRAIAGGQFPRDCPICDYRGSFTAFGMPPRIDAKCLNCGSLERHRLLMLMDMGLRMFRRHHVLLHFAPEPNVKSWVSRKVKRYETADLSAGRLVTHRVNIEDIDLPRRSFDRIICNHVLEHVDDARALRELLRILRPGGKAILTTPVIEGWAVTYENPLIHSEPDRRLHFGQENHVRYFGSDIRDRIRAAGFELTEFTATEPDVHTHGLIRGETIFIATRPG